MSFQPPLLPSPLSEASNATNLPSPLSPRSVLNLLWGSFFAVDRKRFLSPSHYVFHFHPPHPLLRHCRCRPCSSRRRFQVASAHFLWNPECTRACQCVYRFARPAGQVRRGEEDVEKEARNCRESFSRFHFLDAVKMKSGRFLQTNATASSALLLRPLSSNPSPLPPTT